MNLVLIPLAEKFGLSGVDCGLEGSDYLFRILGTKYGCACHDDIRACGKQSS